MIKPDKSWAMIAIGFILPMVVAKAARSAAGASYQSLTDYDPPENPAHPSVAWKEAIAWSAFSGIVGAMASLITKRWMATTDVPTEGYDMDASLEDA